MNKRWQPTAAISIRAMDYHIRFSNLCGFWPLAHQQNRIGYLIYSATIISTAFILFPFGMLVNVILCDNLYDVIDTILFLFTAFSGLKLAFLLHNKQRIRKMFLALHRLDEQLKTTDQRHSFDADGCVQLSQRLCYGLAAYYLIAACFVFMSAWMNPKPELMWSYWLGSLDLSRHPKVYELIMAYQLLSTFMAALACSVVDTFAPAMYNVIGGHLNVLGQRMERLGGGVAQCLFFN